MSRTVAIAILLASPLAIAQQPPAMEPVDEPSCTTTTTTTTTTTCKGAAAPLAAPPRDDQPAPVAPAPMPQPTYVPPPVYYQPWLPARTHVEERPRWGMIAAGLSVFLGVYVWNLTAALLANDWRPAIPVLGPFILLGERDLDGLQALLIFDGLAQLTGAILTIAGAASKVKVTVYDKVSFVPSGAGISGQF